MSDNGALQVDPNLVAQVWKDKHDSAVSENVLLTAGINQLSGQLANTEAELKRVQGELDSLNATE